MDEAGELSSIRASIDYHNYKTVVCTGFKAPPLPPGHASAVQCCSHRGEFKHAIHGASQPLLTPIEPSCPHVDHIIAIRSPAFYVSVLSYSRGLTCIQALPIFLDRLADPITAVLISITVVLIFGEWTSPSRSYMNRNSMLPGLLLLGTTKGTCAAAACFQRGGGGGGGGARKKSCRSSAIRVDLR